MKKLIYVAAFALLCGIAHAQSSIPTGDELSGGGGGGEPVAAGTISGTSTYATPAMAILHSQQLVCIISSTTSAGRCSLAVFEVSNDSLSWYGTGRWNGMTAQADSVAGKRLDQGGVPIILTTVKNVATAGHEGAIRYIPYKWARLKVTAYGAQPLAGVEIEKYAIYDEQLRVVGR